LSEATAGPWPLKERTGLPAEFGWLRDTFPRDRWTGIALPPVAAHWLQMHDGFRQAGAQMDHLVAARGSDALDARGFHDRLLPTLATFLQHLDGHHSIETGHYFPLFRSLEPRIAAGVDLLDRDHDAVHANLEILAARGNAFHHAVRAGRAALSDHADRMAEALVAATPSLLRHLGDEEDIVIPLMARHADAFES